MKPKFQELPNERFVPSGGTDQRATPLVQSADRSRVVPRFDEEFVVRYLTVPRGLLFGTILARIGYWNNAGITTISKYVQGLTLRHVATAVTQLGEPVSQIKRPLRVPAVGLGISFLVSIGLLGTLLGSTADSTATFDVHFGSDSQVTRDGIGGIGLIISAVMLVWLVISMRAAVSDEQQRSRRDLATAFGLVSAAGLITAAGLLLTVPFTTALGAITEDPGIETSVRAGIAQAGSVTLFVAVLPLAIAVALIGQIGKRTGVLPRWMSVTAWFIAVLLFLGWSVGLLLPFALWSIALGLTWKNLAPDETPI